MLESEHFYIALWNGDRLCMWDVYLKHNLETWEYPKIINWEDFLEEVANFALNLAEEKFYKKD